jgi:phosphoribosyl 1,2-cyclic phosphate phosphodiesterase
MKPPTLCLMTARDVQFILLGTGTSAGVPIIGCDCDVCHSNDPKDKRTRCAACVQFTDSLGKPRTILIDASPDLREQSLRHKLHRCDAIVFTHNHVDHTFGLDDVRRFNALMQAPIDIFAERHTMSFLHQVYPHIFRKHENVNDSFVATLIPHLIDPAKPIDLHGVRFTPLRFLHGKLPVLGYRIEALNEHGEIASRQPSPLPLAYCTDVSNIPPETWPKLTNLRTLILDMLRDRKHPTHMTVDESLRAATQIKAQQTRFIHMSHDIRHATLDPTLPQGMALGYDGMVLT